MGHSVSQAVLVLPYLVLIAAAMFLQYYQMKQMNNRNPQAAAANPQMQTMQKFFPIIFGVIYLKVPAGATIYMVVSSAMRIGTQEVMFRTGMVAPVAAEREIGSAKEETAEGEEGETAPCPKPDNRPNEVVGHGRHGPRQGDRAAEAGCGGERAQQRERAEAAQRQGPSRQPVRSGRPDRDAFAEGTEPLPFEAHQKGSITRGVG